MCQDDHFDFVSRDWQGFLLLHLLLDPNYYEFSFNIKLRNITNFAIKTFSNRVITSINKCISLTFLLLLLIFGQWLHICINLHLKQGWPQLKMYCIRLFHDLFQNYNRINMRYLILVVPTNNIPRIWRTLSFTLLIYKRGWSQNCINSSGSIWISNMYFVVSIIWY